MRRFFRKVSLFSFFSSRRRHTRCSRDWSSDVCSSDLLFEPFYRGPEREGATPGWGLGLAFVKRIAEQHGGKVEASRDRKSTRLNSSHGYISYAVFCLKKKKHEAVQAQAIGVKEL